jgi:hypothetical protein
MQRSIENIKNILLFLSLIGELLKEWIRTKEVPKLGNFKDRPLDN